MCGRGVLAFLFRQEAIYSGFYLRPGAVSTIGAFTRIIAVVVSFGACVA